MENVELTMLTKTDAHGSRDAINDPDAQVIFETLMDYNRKIKTLEAEVAEYMKSVDVSAYAFRVVDSHVRDQFKCNENVKK